MRAAARIDSRVPRAERATYRLRIPGNNGTGTTDWVLILDAGYPPASVVSRTRFDNGMLQ